jgi:hypothetical protein
MGLASASEFQSERSLAFYKNFGNTNNTLCIPPDGPWAALGYGAQIELFQPSIMVTQSKPCSIFWSSLHQKWAMQT